VTDIQQFIPPARSSGRGFHAYSARHLDMLTARAGLAPDERLAVRAVATVLPFRVNSYVIENLIDWDAAPADPIYRLVFPQPDMLPAADVQRLADLISGGEPEAALRAAAHEIRMRLNPHPAGQLLLNAPSLHGRPLPGLQHKYPETVLFFPRQGQTCHAYCTYCFRWAQFVDEPDLKMATDDIDTLVAYLGEHPEVTSVLITGGDPMIMGEPVLRRYLEPLLDPRLDHLESIRIGTKSLSYWPQRFVTDPDADATLRLFGEVADSGRTLALMAHFSHPRELEPPVLAEAVRRIRDTGAVIRTQAPLIRSINDDAATWRAMWRTQVRRGMIPYYMFVERDTGPQDYFAVPLARGLRPGADGPRPVHVGHPRQGLRGRGGRGGRPAGVRAADDPGPGPAPGRDAVLRPVRPGRDLADRPRAGLRGPVPVRAVAVRDRAGRAARALAGRAGRADGPGHLTGR
jgi:KamA family protein